MINKTLKYMCKFHENPKSEYIEQICNNLFQKGFISKMTHSTQIGGLKLGDMDSLLNFIKNRVGDEDKKTSKKYFVILFGPPGSGKTLGRKMACHGIKTFYEESLNETDIEKTFIETGIDEITYDVELKDDFTVRDKLMKNLDGYIGEADSIEIKKELVKENINNLVFSSFSIYRNNRPDYLSELLFYLAAFFDKNIFFEVATPQNEYIKNLINVFCNFYKYHPVLIYPFVNDVNILYDRTISRGLKEGRFVACDGPYGLQKIVASDLKSYEDLKDILKNAKDKIDWMSYLSIMYNANISLEDYNKINNNKFGTFSKYYLEIIYPNIKNNEQQYWKDENYNKKINLDLNCN